MNKKRKATEINRYHFQSSRRDTIIVNFQFSIVNLIKPNLPLCCPDPAILLCLSVPLFQNKVHKMLVLGMICPNMDYYCNGLINDLDILDRNRKKEVKLEESDLQETYKQFNEQIAKFKEENPDSPVMLLNHAGQRVVQMLCNHCDLDLVLNGHDHKDEATEFTSATTGKKTYVCSLSENAKKLEAVNVHFDDDGKFSFNSKTLYVQLQNQDAEFKAKFDEIFAEDNRRIG